jgi:SPP1 gp7 family putative phage head morphogenesis protein
MSWIGNLFQYFSWRKPAVTESAELQEVLGALEDMRKELLHAGADASNAFGVGTRRSSVSENAYLENSFGAITPEYLQTVLPKIKKLALGHHDFALAISNIMHLGNTKQEVFFDDAVSPRNARKMRTHLIERERAWFPNSSMTGFVNALFLQAMVYGAISAEAVPNLNLTGLAYLTTVDAENIVFFMRGGLPRPYQLVRLVPINNKNSSPYIALNTEQYRYLPVMQGFSTPYGIPPFLAAMFSAEVQQNMSINFMNIARRLGAFGFLNVLLEAPGREKDKDGNWLETKDEYEKRVQGYIDKQATKIKDGFNNGYVVGVKGKHEFELAGNGTNASNAATMFELVDTQLSAGLKTDPSLLGRSRVVTETFGRVLLQILSSQVQTIQDMIADFLSFARLMELKMAGFKVTKVVTKFAPPLPGDAIKDQQERQLRISNVKELLALGIISLEQAAQELGYDQPAGGEGVPTPSSTKKTVPPAPDGRTEPSAVGKRFSQIFEMPDVYLAYDRTKWGDSKTQGFADGYINDTEAAYKKQARRIAESVGKVLVENADATVDEWVAIAQQGYEEGATAFQKDMPKVAKKHVPPMYKYYREDTSIFPKEASSVNSFAFTPPTPVLNLPDLRAIEWIQGRDVFYLSKFITDPDTIKLVLEFIREFHLERGEAIGDNNLVLSEFINRFVDVLDGQVWKIRRVLDTSVNSIRSYANVAYMQQAAVAEFKVLEIMDRITCAHCRNMNGRIFSVSTAAERINTLTQSTDYENIGNIAPFATSIPIADLTGMTSGDLQAKGISTTPFHPSCRGTLVAMV